MLFQKNAQSRRRISIVAPVKPNGMRSLDSAEGFPHSPMLPLKSESATPLEAEFRLLLGQCGRILAVAQRWLSP